MKFTKDERTRIKLWLEKSPKADDKGKECMIQRSDGTALTLHRETVYYGTWKVRIALEATTRYPICMSGPILIGSDSKGPKDKPAWVMVPKLPKAAGPPTPKGTMDAAKFGAIMQEVYAPSFAYQIQDSVVFNTIPQNYDDHDQPPVKKKATKGAFQKAVKAEMDIIKKAMKGEE